MASRCEARVPTFSLGTDGLSGIIRINQAPGEEKHGNRAWDFLAWRRPSAKCIIPKKWRQSQKSQPYSEVFRGYLRSYFRVWICSRGAHWLRGSTAISSTSWSFFFLLPSYHLPGVCQVCDRKTSNPATWVTLLDEWLRNSAFWCNFCWTKKSVDGPGKESMVLLLQFTWSSSPNTSEMSLVVDELKHHRKNVKSTVLSDYVYCGSCSSCPLWKLWSGLKE